MPIDNEILDLLLELDNLEREFSVAVIGPPARRLQALMEHLREKLWELEAEVELTRNELRSKRFQRESPRNQVITRDWEKQSKDRQ